MVFCVRQTKFFFGNSTIIIAIDDGGVAFAKVGGTVCIVADAVGRDILMLIFLRDIVVRRNCGCGTDRRAGAFSINVCVDNGIAGAAVDVNITGGAILVFALLNTGTDRRVDVTGSII